MTLSSMENNDSIPKRRSFAAGGSAYSANSSATSGSLWLSMGVDRVNRKLSDTWILDINSSTPTTGIFIVCVCACIRYPHCLLLFVMLKRQPSDNMPSWLVTGNDNV